MPKRRALTLLAVLIAAGAVVSNPDEVRAQAATPSLPGTPQTTPSLPGGPQPTPSYPSGPRVPFGVQGGMQGGSGNYAASAAANEHAAFLWVVDNIQHSVVLCEKTDSGKDFTCTRKPLP
jgi:hypothetical protein